MSSITGYMSRRFPFANDFQFSDLKIDKSANKLKMAGGQWATCYCITQLVVVGAARRIPSNGTTTFDVACQTRLTGRSNGVI